MAYYQDIHRNIIEKSMAGNGHAQRELYDLYSKAMYNLCYRMMNNREEAEDQLQEAFIEAFSQLGKFRFESAFGAWLKRITVNKCINALRKRRVELVPVGEMPEIPHDDTEPELPSLTVEEVRQALEKLPEGYRVIFSLYLLEGYDHVEISQIMGISEETSKSQYSRARQKIKEIIKNDRHGRDV